MVISDYPFEVGQTVAWNMSFIEQEGPEVDEKYVSRLNIYTQRRRDIAAKKENKEED